jgi:uncharacterized small protein (DUF1192 family)
MRSATPKDEAAEWEYCLEQSELMTGEGMKTRSWRIRRARAAARASELATLQAEVERLTVSNATHNDIRDQQEAMIANLTVEIWRLRQERDQIAFERDTHMEANQERAATYHTNGVQSLTKQVSELKAENERLRAYEYEMHLELERHR